MNGLLSLKWNNHSSAFLNRLSNLLVKELYADATIVCQGKYFPVHRLILSTCSVYFEEIFEKTQCRHPFIIIKDIDALLFEALLNYMYRGEVNVLQALLPGLIKAAESLKIKGLAIPDESEESSHGEKRKILTAASSQNYQSKKIRSEERKEVLIPKICDTGEKVRKDENRKIDYNTSSDLKSSQTHDDDPKLITIKSELPDAVEDSSGTFNILSVTSGIHIEDETKVEVSVFEPGMQLNDKESSISSAHSDIAQWNSGISENEDNIHSSVGGEDEVITMNCDHLPENDGWSDNILTLVGDIPRNNSFSTQDHQLSSSEATATKCQWAYCTFVHSDLSEMEIHVTNKHLGNKPYYCCICDFRTNSNMDLKNHLSHFHPYEKLYSCYLCNYRADSFSNLIKHIRIHTGEKPFSCPFCRYRTAQNNNLVRHVRHHHGDLA